MTPIDIQVSRSKVSVEGQAYFLYVGEGGALVFYKHLFFHKVFKTDIRHNLLVQSNMPLLPSGA